jgi:hypothetical protein
MADDFVKRGKWAGSWKKCAKMTAGEQCTNRQHRRHQKHWTGTWYYPVGGQDAGYGEYVMKSKKRQDELKKEFKTGKRKKKWWQ